MEQRLLSPEDRLLIEEEQALLARVQQALESARIKARERVGNQALLAQLEVLREEASTAPVADLPHLFYQMNEARSLIERRQAIQIPGSESPYFAHLRVETEGTVRDYLLGRNTWAQLSSDVRIIDWRFAPIARLFYGYEEGDAYEETFGDRTAEGTILTRRLVVIERGELTQVIAGRTVLRRDEDGAWHSVGGGAGSVLAGGAGSAAREGSLGVGVRRSEDAFGVTALLDPEQYDAVSTHAEDPLLVLGSAGSGKTTVALHRLAKVAFDAPERYPASRLKVIVPEEGLARLSRRLLTPLGLEKVSVDTLEAWSIATARQAFDVPRIKLWHEAPPLVSRLKRHPALRLAISARVGVPRENQSSLKALRRKLVDAFSDRHFLESVVAASRGGLPLTAIDETLEHTRLQNEDPLSRQFEGVDADRLVTVDGRSLDEGTPDALAGTLDVEDLPILLFLKAQGGKLGVPRIAHAVLDEAEDFSLFELAVVGRLLGPERSCTLSGDELQQTSSSFGGWDAALSEVGIRDARTVRLQVSYRCPQPVVELARHVLGTQAPEAHAKRGRQGAPVGLHHFPEPAQAALFIGEALRDLVQREPRASVAVICASEASARAFHPVIADLPSARLVVEGDFTFEPGIDVTQVDAVKGLEFDYVVIPDATATAWPEDPEARRRFHVAITRASHQLWVVSSGVRSPLLAGVGQAS